MSLRSASHQSCRIFFLLALAGMPTAAWAENSSHRLTEQARATREGLGSQARPLLDVVPQDSGPQVLNLLLQRLGLGSHRPAGTDELSVAGPEGTWRLSVTRDGTHGRYENRSGAEQRMARALRSQTRLSWDRLEALGRERLQTTLQGIVHLGDKEQVVSLKAVHETVGRQGRADRFAQEAVVASTIVFTRTIDGVSVLGAGSKVAITFSSEGQLLGLAFDWPRYARRPKLQRPVELAQILGRLDTSFSRLRRFSPARAVQVGDLRRLECGYFDRGARRRGPAAAIQLACLAELTERKPFVAQDRKVHLAGGFGTVVPVGIQFEPDPSWRETTLLAP